MLIHDRELPDALAAPGFMFGSVLGFAFVGLTRHFDSDHGEAPVMWGSFHFLSVAMSIGATVVLTYLSKVLF